MSSSRLKLPPTLIALVFIASALILTSALPIRQIKPLPNPIILALNERLRYWADDYFAGFNLTYDLFGKAEKVKALDVSTFNTKATLTSSKSFQTTDGRLIMAYLHEDLKVTVVPFEDDGLSKSFQVPLTDAKVCFDLDFLDQNTIVVDCNMEDGKAYLFISVKTKKITKVAENEEKFKKHQTRQLRAANGFNGADLITLISSDDTKTEAQWQISFITLDNNNNIDSVIKVSADDIPELRDDFRLRDVLAISSTELLLTGANYLYLAKPEGKTLGSLVLYPVDDNSNTFSSLQSSGPLLSTILTSDSSAYEILRSKEGGYLEVADIFVDSVYKMDSRLNGKDTQIEHAQVTKDFVILVTTGARPSIYIFKRGDSKSSEIFFFNYLSPQDFPFDEPIKLHAHYDKNLIFWVTDDSVQTLGIQDVWLELLNDEPSPSHILPLTVCSETYCITQKLEVVCLGEDDYHIYQLNKNDLKFIKNYNEPLNIVFDDLFAAPHINYKLQNQEGATLAAPVYVQIGLSVGDLSTSFMSVDYDEKNNKFRLHVQQEGGKSLDLYLCNLPNKDSKDAANPPYLNCDKKTSDTVSGQVQRIYSDDPLYDIVEIADKDGYRIPATSTKKLSSKLIPFTDACDVMYKSYDNHIESNTFCAKGNNISIYTNSSYVNIDHIVLDDDFKPKQILTHPAFPGLLFISNSTAISIINSEFYLGPHYGHDVATINTIPILDDPDFRFVVTSSHIVVFLPKNDSISEFDITNPLDIIFNKQYMTHGAKLLVNERTIAYSPVTDLIYSIVTVPFDTSVTFLVVLEPNGLGSVNFKYVFNTTTTKYLNKFVLSVTSFDSETDVVLHGAPGGVKGLIVGKESKVTFDGNNVGDSELFAERNFIIKAESPYTGENSTKNVKIYFINTQRNIKALEGTQDLRMDLAFNNYTRILFKEKDFFNGPAFKWSTKNEVENDNIKLVPRVHPAEILGSNNLPLSISDIAYPRRRIARGLILILEKDTQKIHVYNSSNFPAPESKLPSPEVYGLNQAVNTSKCYQVEMDPNQVYMAALCYDELKSASYIDIFKASDNLLHYQLITPTEDPRALYKVIGDYLLYTTRNSYNAVYVYKISQDGKNLKVDQLRIINRDELTLGRKDNITDMDGFLLRPGQSGVFIATGSTGFNYLFLQGDKIKISSYPDFLSLFASDHLQGYNSVPVFHALQLLRRAATGDSDEFTLILGSKNAFSYKLSVVTDKQGNINSIQVLEGYIQYHNYRWIETIAASADTVVLLGYIPGSGFAGIGTNLLYFFYDQRSVPTLNTSYPLYDAFQVLDAGTPFNPREKPHLLLLKRRAEELLYVKNTVRIEGISGDLKGYKIEDAFSLETPASRVSSSYVELTASNDFWSSTIKIPVQNYGNVLPGVSPGKIILFVFGGLGLAFIIAAVLIKVFSNKDKRNLKDSNFVSAVPGETGQTTGETTDASQYFKIED